MKTSIFSIRFFLGILSAFILILSCSDSDDEAMEMQEEVVSDSTSVVDDPPPPPPEEEEERTYLTDGVIVGDLTADIYYPSDYDSTRSYPIIYCNEGSNFGEVYGKLLSLEASPFIMVGIEGSNSRAERFLPYFDPNLDPYEPKAEEYTLAIINELIPEVESRYSVNDKKRAIFGISFSGIHATWAGIRYPEVFTFSAAFSPSYWVADNTIYGESTSQLKVEGFGARSTFYFDRGTSEWRSSLPMILTLQGGDLTYGRDIYYYEAIGGRHDTPSWSLRVEVPFRLFMEGSNKEIVSFDVNSYCVEENGSEQGRINPTVTLANNVIFSVMPLAEYEITSGSGDILSDGRYALNSSTMTVEVSYEGFTSTVELRSCN